MARRTFGQILASAEIDIAQEFDNLYEYVNSDRSHYSDSFMDEVDENFESFSFRGTCVTRDHFDRRYKFEFDEIASPNNIDTLVDYMEYLLNFADQLTSSVTRYVDYDLVRKIAEHIDLLCEKIGYMTIKDEDGLFACVEKSHEATMVASLVPENYAYEVIAYNHHSMRGDLEAKRTSLAKFAKLLEPRKYDLRAINSKLCNGLFFALNSFGIRHSNEDVLLNIKDEELESIYDDTYQMFLLAYLALETRPILEQFERLRQKRDD